MTLPQRLLVGFYALVALAALVGTFSQNMQLSTANGPLGAYVAFLDGAKENPAARSLAIDISLFLLAAVAFMVIEARRLGVGFVWLYVIGGFLIAISVTFPLFMIARELKLKSGGPADAPWRLTASDVIGLLLTTAVVAAIFRYTLT